MQLQADSVWLATQPVDIRAGIDRLSLHVQQARQGTLRRHGVCVQQSAAHPLESCVLGRQWRLDVRAATASRSIRLAAGWRH